MKSFKIKPEIKLMESIDEFIETFLINEKDLIFMSERVHEQSFKHFSKSLTWIDHRKYGNGEPSDEMVDEIYADLNGKDYDRVIAIGGGTVLDIAKCFALEKISPIKDLFNGVEAPKKVHQLILIPTTCGTGSEVTNISILEFKEEKTKKGLASDEIYADVAILIPNLLNHIPMNVVGTSSADALIHAIESYTSPKANEFTRLFSKRAMKGIIKSYRKIVSNEMKVDSSTLHCLLYSSTMAGIAFGNAGCATVHALSYPLGASYHIPHGQANAEMLFSVYDMYIKKDPHGKVYELQKVLSAILECDVDDVFLELEHLLNYFVQRKGLKDYGIGKKELIQFTHTVISSQQRLLKNSCVSLSEDELLQIYESAY